MLCTIMALTLASPAPPAPRPAPLPRLKTQGIRIVDPRGTEVKLRGINVGGWLLEEMWMCPFVQDPPAGSSFEKVTDSERLWATLEKRLGRASVERLRTAYRESWLRESDFALIRAAGFNHVRVPFRWTVLEERNGMEWLRKAVRWANANGMYAILDMHGMPGSQSGDHTTGEAGRNKFFFDPAHVAHAEKLWTRVAREFGRNPGVAAFDLINEPTGAPNPATLHVVHDRLYRVVRKAAPDTMIIIDDGYKGFDTTPHADVAGWTNMVYSLHFYHFDAKAPEEHLTRLNSILPRTLELRGYRNAPVYIGEFNLEPHGRPEVMASYIKTLSDNSLSWAVWTFKTVAPHGPMGFWGFYSNPKPIDPVNPFTDDEATILTKWNQVRTEQLAPVRELIPVYRGSATP